MATVPGQLVWEMVKNNNYFLVKQFGRGEPNNLYNLNSYKYSGLANKKTVTIQPGSKDQGVVLATSKTKKQNKPASLLHKSVLKKEFHRNAKTAENQKRAAKNKERKLGMSVKRSLSLNKSNSSVKVNDQQISAKRGRFGRCFSLAEVPIEPGKSLKDLNSNKFKIDIRRWAKAVVAYARQVSGQMGKSQSNRIGSSRDLSQDSGSSIEQLK